MIEAWRIGEFEGEDPVRVPTYPVRSLVRARRRADRAPVCGDAGGARARQAVRNQLKGISDGPEHYRLAHGRRRVPAGADSACISASRWRC